MSENNLKKKSVLAVIWSTVEATFNNGFQFVISVVLARLILPEDFGTIALLYLFTGLTTVLIHSGFTSALIQRQNASYTDECTVFWLNIGLGTCFSLFLWLISPLIANFYDRPVLVDLTGILALSLFINSTGSIQNTLLIKNLNFKKLTFINTLAAGIAGATAITLAIKGFGVWALAAQLLVSSVVMTAALWITSSWRPSLTFSKQSTQSLFAFGSYLMMAAILDSIYTRLYTVLLGKFYTVRDLAFYSRADRTQQLPVEVLSGVLARVTYPIFSATSQDKPRLLKGVKIALEGIMLVNLPMMFGLLVTADTLVPVLFGENWSPAVPMLQILCLAGMLWPLHVINLDILKAQGLSHLFFRLEVIKKIVGTSLLFAGLPWGPIGIAWSQVAAGILGFLINAHYTRIHLNYGALKQITEILPIFAISGLMAGIVLLVEYMLSLEPLYLLLLQVLTGGISYFLLCLIFGINAYKQSLGLLRSIKQPEAPAQPTE